MSKFLILLVVEALIIGVLFMLISRGTLTTAYKASQLTIAQTGSYFIGNFIIISIAAGTAILIAGIFIFVYLTHRLGGPLYKIEKVLNEAAGGNLKQRIQLRSTDEFVELKSAANRLLEERETSITQIKSYLNELEDILKNKAEQDISSYIRDSIANIKDHISKYDIS